MANILIVDDSTFMRQLLCTSLNEMGHEVVEAGEGQDALNKVIGQQFDLVISDVNMPVVDGLELVEKLRALPSYKYTPILMLSSESAREVKQRSKALGVTGWLVKPFNPEKLMATVNKVLSLRNAE